MGKDLKRIISMTVNWGIQRQVFHNRVFISPERGYTEPYELRHLNEALGTRRLGKNRKRNRNGGGERNFRYYGNAAKANIHPPKRIYTDEYAGKSSRKYHRMKKSWWEDVDDGY